MGLDKSATGESVKALFGMLSHELTMIAAVLKDPEIEDEVKRNKLDTFVEGYIHGTGRHIATDDS